MGPRQLVLQHVRRPFPEDLADPLQKKLIGTWVIRHPSLGLSVFFHFIFHLARCFLSVVRFHGTGGAPALTQVHTEKKVAS